MRHTRTALVCLLGTVAMAGIVASTTADLRDLTLISVPGIAQVPGVILVGMLCAFALRSAAAAAIALVVIAISAAFLHGLAISLAAIEIEPARVSLLNRATVQGFFALLLIFFLGMVGVVTAQLINVYVRRLDV